jgi:hypothetical protein
MPVPAELPLSAGTILLIRDFGKTMQHCQGASVKKTA